MSYQSQRPVLSGEISIQGCTYNASVLHKTGQGAQLTLQIQMPQDRAVQDVVKRHLAESVSDMVLKQELIVADGEKKQSSILRYEYKGSLKSQENVLKQLFFMRLVDGFVVDEDPNERGFDEMHAEAQRQAKFQHMMAQESLMQGGGRLVVVLPEERGSGNSSLDGDWQDIEAGGGAAQGNLRALEDGKEGDACSEKSSEWDDCSTENTQQQEQQTPRRVPANKGPDSLPSSFFRSCGSDE